MHAAASFAGQSAALGLVYHFCRCQRPQLPLSRELFEQRLQHMFARGMRVSPELTPEGFLAHLHPLDAFLVMGCVERLDLAWEMLFASRAGRSDRLLVDALRWHAVRFFPQNETLQEEHVCDFWSHLLAADQEESVPLLLRYDGQRPLVPWLIHCFRNYVITQERKRRPQESLGDLDARDGHASGQGDARWSEVFAEAARSWLAHLKEEEIALLGLRWRYRLSQREIAKVFSIHEGNIAKRIDKLRDKCLHLIGENMEAGGWTGDDLQGFILREMDSLLLEDHRLTAEQLARLLHKLGLKVEAPLSVAS